MSDAMAKDFCPRCDNFTGNCSCSMSNSAPRETVSMREKMATAIQRAYEAWALDAMDMETATVLVDAALDAMFEPTAAMWDAFPFYAGDRPRRELDSRTVWQAYLRAAKAGK